MQPLRRESVKMVIEVAAVLKQIDDVLQEADRAGAAAIRQASDHTGEWDNRAIAVAVTLVSTCIDRLAAGDSHYRSEAARVRAKFPGPNWTQYDPLVGILNALRADFATGRLETLRELIHGELFADFLEAAKHLLDEG